MKLNIKSILKSFKLNESIISMVLGALVIVVVGVLVANYFKERKGILPQTGANTEVTGNAFGAKKHIVAKGESLWTIAEKEIGSGYNWTDIAKANNISNPSIIFEGTELTIPSVEAKVVTNNQGTTTLEETAVSTNKDTISGATYQVVKGDDLWDISIRAYGDGYKWVEIARENKLANPNLIHPGNILILPR